MKDSEGRRIKGVIHNSEDHSMKNIQNTVHKTVERLCIVFVFKYGIICLSVQ